MLARAREDLLAVLELLAELHRAGLRAVDRGVGGVLGEPEAARDAAGAGAADVAGHALDLGVVESLDGDAVVGPEDLDRGGHLADLLRRDRGRREDEEPGRGQASDEGNAVSHRAGPAHEAVCR